MSPTVRIFFWVSLAAISLMARTARISGAQASAPTKEEKLEQDFTDPLATLPQLSIRDAYSPATYGTNVETNQVIIRPIIPRVPPYTLLPFAQLVRPTISVVTTTTLSQPGDYRARRRQDRRRGKGKLIEIGFFR